MRHILLLALFACVPTFAQRGSAEVKASFGSVVFADDGAVDHFLAGGAVRYYLTRRLSIEPEILYLRGGGRHYDVVLSANVAYDFGGRRFVPYVVGGPGIAWSKFPFNSGSSEYFSGGGGVKIYLSDGWFVAPEFRVGWEPHVRISGAIGYTWRP